MSYSLFLLPAVAPIDRAVVWQLQLLASARGFTVRSSRRTKLKVISEATKREIRASDAVLMILTVPPDRAAIEEFVYASASKKPVLALVEETVQVPAVMNRLHGLRFARGQDIGDLGAQIMDHVNAQLRRRKDSTPEAIRALGWILGIGLALFALGALTGNDDEAPRPARS